MQQLRLRLSELSPIERTALLFGIVLVGAIGFRVFAYVAPDPALPVAEAATPSQPMTDAEWQQELMLLGFDIRPDPEAAAQYDPLSVISPAIAGQILGKYTALIQNGDYTTEDLQTVGAEVAKNMRALVPRQVFESSDFSTVADSSTERVRQYRDDLLAALDPINKISTAEFEMYGLYVETKDPHHIEHLKEAAATYRVAVAAAEKIVVPRDAVDYHRDILNALSHFGAAIDGLALYADDPITSVALLRTYTEAESQITNSYYGMRAYYARKSL